MDSNWSMETSALRRRTRRTWPVALFALSLLVGLGVGLSYAWILNPVVYVEASPARLSNAHQTEYIYLIGRSYTADPDLTLAETRLTALDRPDVQQVVLDVLESGIREGRPLDDIRALAGLARALGAQAPAIALFAPPMESAATLPIAAEQAPPAVPTGILAISPAAIAAQTTPTPAATPNTTPAAAPTATTAQFQLLNREQLCPPENEGGRIEVLVVDAEGTPQPGTAIIVSWPEGSDRFVTGFKEGGFGDFTMQPDITYIVTLPDGRTRTANLRVEQCSDNQPTTWRLTFLKAEG